MRRCVNASMMIGVPWHMHSAGTCGIVEADAGLQHALMASWALLTIHHPPFSPVVIKGTAEAAAMPGSVYVHSTLASAGIKAAHAAGVHAIIGLTTGHKAQTLLDAGATVAVGDFFGVLDLIEQHGRQ